MKIYKIQVYENRIAFQSYLVLLDLNIPVEVEPGTIITFELIQKIFYDALFGE